MNFLCRVGLAENEISDAPLPHRKQGTFLAFDFSQTQLEFPLTVYGSFIFVLFTELFMQASDATYFVQLPLRQGFGFIHVEIMEIPLKIKIDRRFEAFLLL